MNFGFANSIEFCLTLKVTPLTPVGLYPICESKCGRKNWIHCKEVSISDICVCFNHLFHKGSLVGQSKKQIWLLSRTYFSINI